MSEYEAEARIPNPDGEWLYVVQGKVIELDPCKGEVVEEDYHWLLD